MSRLPRCRTCLRPIAFFRSPFTGKVRTFDPVPVDGHHQLAGVKAFPVQGMAAHKPADLAELIQVQRACSEVEAAAEVRDMAWHLLHECTDPTDQPTEKETDPS